MVGLCSLTFDIRKVMCVPCHRSSLGQATGSSKTQLRGRKERRSLSPKTRKSFQPKVVSWMRREREHVMHESTQKATFVDDTFSLHIPAIDPCLIPSRLLNHIAHNIQPTRKTLKLHPCAICRGACSHVISPIFHFISSL